MPEERLTATELERLCFGEGDRIIGDERGAASYTMKRFGDYIAAWLLLVAVAPSEQRRGVGRTLVNAVCDAARDEGARDLHLASAVPRYIWPGVDLANTRAGMLFEAMGFERDLVGINMAINTEFRCDPPEGVVIERELGDGALEFTGREYAHWTEELSVAIDKGTAFAARRDDGATIGYACHSVNRRAWIGPMATEPSRQHGGVGSALLAALCEDLARDGIPTGEISWVSNLRFYGKCGATVSRIFQGGRLPL
jgi:GNAT superfamily N-acetyltransferase